MTTKPSAIDEMAKRAAEQLNGTTFSYKEDATAQVAAIIAPHYRAGVRELVLAAREVERSGLVTTDDVIAAVVKIQRLREALKDFRDVH